MNIDSIALHHSIIFNPLPRLGVCLKLVSLEVPSHKLVGEEASLECRCGVIRVASIL